MPADCITYQNSGYFSKLIVDYLNQEKKIKPLYNRFPTLENFKHQIAEKQENFPTENRKTLVNSLQKQYAKLEISEKTKQNIALLASEKTFTITTGHQLNLFTGPLYFLYKIISVINLTKELKKEYPNNNFVPVYWMATEDHDFDEINYFNFKGKKVQWSAKVSGPVGRLKTESLQKVFDSFSNELGIGENAQFLRNLFKNAYLENETLAEATRYLANTLFKKEGLVIIDGDDVNLKKVFASYTESELLQKASYNKVKESNVLLKDYNIQVNPREINLFYIQDNLRERIIFEKGKYVINNTKLAFSEREIKTELENYPERFSPNVILRPLYQEVILPNLCYIGGGGELAYWLELKSNFEHNNITFPIVLLRNSVLIASEKQSKKLKKLGLSWSDLFLSQNELTAKQTKKHSPLAIDFSQQKEHLKKQFENLYKIANETDSSFFGAVAAQEKKQIKGLETLEKRLLKAEKRVHTDILNRIILLQNELFPNQSLQERKQNFSEYYLAFGENLQHNLVANLKPLEQKFTIVVL